MPTMPDLFDSSLGAGGSRRGDYTFHAQHGVNNADFHAAILGTSLGALAVFERIGLAVPLGGDDFGVNTRLNQVITHFGRAPFGQLLVVLLCTDVVRVAIHVELISLKC